MQDQNGNFIPPQKPPIPPKTYWKQVTTGGKIAIVVSLIFGIVLLNAFVQGFMRGINGENTNTAQPQITKEEYIRTTYDINADMVIISLTDLRNEYKNNEVAATNNYKGETIVVIGYASDISYSWLGNKPYISLGERSTSTIGGAMCYFDDDGILTDLNTGDEVIIIGTVKNYTLSSVTFENCELLE